MRVILASLHPRAFSGQVHSLRALARYVGALGHDVRTITVSLPENPKRLPSSVHYLASTLQVVRTIAREGGGADLVHLNLPTPGFTLLADWLASRLSVPLVVGFEAPLISGDLFGAVFAETRRQPVFYIPRLVINNALVARVARYGAAAYVVSSQYQRHQIQRLGVKAPISVIPNVVDFEMGEDDGRALARQRLELPESDPIVGIRRALPPGEGRRDARPGVRRATRSSAEGQARAGLEWPRRLRGDVPSARESRLPRRRDLPRPDEPCRPAPSDRRARAAVSVPDRPELLPERPARGSGHRRAAGDHGHPGRRGGLSGAGHGGARPVRRHQRARRGARVAARGPRAARGYGGAAACPLRRSLRARAARPSVRAPLRRGAGGSGLAEPSPAHEHEVEQARPDVLQ